MAAHGSAQPWLWATTVVLAHVFAAVWLLRALYFLVPGCWPATKQKLRRLRGNCATRCLELPVDDAAKADALARRRAVSLHSQDAELGPLHFGVLVHHPQPAVVEVLDSSTQLPASDTNHPNQADGNSSDNDSASDSGSVSDHMLDGVVVPVAPACAKKKHHMATVATPQNEQLSAPSRLQLEWCGLGCSYPTPTGDKAVLADVWGTAGAGQLQALLGPSGAGKSTLLDLLAGRKATGRLAGRVLLNGEPLSPSGCRKLAAYVPQEDNFVPTMTAAETLTFYAALTHNTPKQPAVRRATGQSAPAPALAPVAAVAPAASAGTGCAAGSGVVHTMVHVWTSDGSSENSTCSNTDTNSSGPVTSGAGHTAAGLLQARVAEVLGLVGLTPQASTLVGGQLPGGLGFRGLSGGERKRLSLAAGLLGSPGMLFLDEPTSGLDSSAALSVVSHLQQLAVMQHKLVLVCVHQPRAAIWSLFDKVTLLAGGRLIYTGPAGGLQPWFSQRLGCSYKPAVHGLASDWALDLVAFNSSSSSSGAGSSTRQPVQVQMQGMLDSPLQSEQDLLEASQLFLTHYHSTRQQQQQNEVPHIQEQQQQQQPPQVILGTEISTCLDLDHQLIRTYTTSGSSSSNSNSTWSRAGLVRLWQQYKALTWRELLAITRNPADVAGRTLTFCWVAVLVGLIYYDLPTSASSIRARINLLYSALCFFMLMPFISMGLYVQDKQFYVRDTAARLYSPLAYYLAKVTATTPFSIITALACDLPLYGLTGMRHGAAALVQHATISSVLLLVAGQVLHLTASLCPNQDLAFMAAIAWTCLNLLLSGFFITFQEMAFRWMTYLRYTSAMHFAFEGLLQVELGGRTFDCSQTLTAGEERLLGLVSGLMPTATSDVTPYVGMYSTGGGSSSSSSAGYSRPPAQQQQQQHQQQAVALPRLVNSWLTSASSTGRGCTVETSAILSYFDFGRSFGSTVGCLLAYWGVLHVATYLSLVLLARKERR